MKTNIYTIHKRLSVLNVMMIAVILMGADKTYAQTENEMTLSKHEVSVHVKGPFSGFQYKHGQDKQKLGSGAGFGINYTHYLNQQWSLTTGAELQFFKGKVSYNSVSDTYSTVDAEDEAFEFRYRVQDLTELQSATYLNVPIKVQYESTGKRRFYAAGGAKIGFNLNSRYESTISSLTTSGYYSQYDAELNDPLFMGFGEFGSIENGKSDLGLKTNLAIDLETGVKFMMANNRALYIGLFLDYGLTNLNNNSAQQNLISYNVENPTAFKSPSVRTSSNKLNGKAYIDKMNTVAFGFKLRYALSL